MARLDAFLALDRERLWLEAHYFAPDRIEALALIDETQDRLNSMVGADEWAAFVHAHRGELSQPTRDALLAVNV